MNSELIDILTRVRTQVTDDSDMADTGFADPCLLRGEIDGLIGQLRQNTLEDPSHLSALFYPTGTLQAHALANNWSVEYLQLAERFDKITASVIDYHDHINIPTDRPVYQGDIATYWIDEGILVSLSKSVKRTVENIACNVALVKQITGDKKMPLMIYLKNSPMPDKAARKFSTEQLPKIYTAMAMVSKPGLAVFIMKLLFGFQSPPIPMRHFTNEEEARKWLKQFL